MLVFFKEFLSSFSLVEVLSSWLLSTSTSTSLKTNTNEHVKKWNKFNLFTSKDQSAKPANYNINFASAVSLYKLLRISDYCETQLNNKPGFVCMVTSNCCRSFSVQHEKILYAFLFIINNHNLLIFCPEHQNSFLSYWFSNFFNVCFENQWLSY